MLIVAYRLIIIYSQCTSKDKVALLQPCAEGPMGVALIKLMADITETAGAVWNNSTRHLDGVPTVFIDGVSSFFRLSEPIHMTERLVVSVLCII